MPIFYLEPHDGDTTDPRWKATSLHEGCWVLAQSEDHARLLVEQATIKMVDVEPGKPVLYPPWQDRQLVDCRPDTPGIDVPEGIIVTAGGKTIS